MGQKKVTKGDLQEDHRSKKELINRYRSMDKNSSSAVQQKQSSYTVERAQIAETIQLQGNKTH